jgi:hypothetical protein
MPNLLRLQTERHLFPWDSVDPGTADFLRQAEIMLRKEVRTQSHSILAAGGILRQVKDVLPHGQFLLFVRKVMGYRVRSAQNYMSAHRAFAASKSETIAPLRSKAIYRLAAMAADEQEEILAELEGPSPDIPAIEERILRSETKSVSEEATQVLSILQQIADLLKTNLTGQVFGEFCRLINHPAILASAKLLSPHLQNLFPTPAADSDEEKNGAPADPA